jgi:threonine/homoserine/homoserine lactone efflux protein
MRKEGMTAQLLASMAAFALAASLTPGPVNLVALSAGMRYGVRASMSHVTGATVGFTLLLVAIGAGMHQLFERWPSLLTLIRWAGVAFLLFMAYKLARDDGRLGRAEQALAPSFWVGATMQWLNPKAWLASIAGMGVYAAGGGGERIAIFATLYFIICYLSVGCWAVAGALLGRRLQTPARIRGVNRLLAVLLAASALVIGLR